MRSTEWFIEAARLVLTAPLLVIALSCVSTPALQLTQNVKVTGILVPAKPVSEYGEFVDAEALSRDQMGNTYIIDRGTSSLYKYGAKFDSVRSVSGLGRDHYQFDQPVDVDARQSNNIFIADYANNRIEQYSKELAYLLTLYTREDPNLTSRFGYPLGVALDDAGNLFFIDGENKRVLKANSSFQFDREIGSYATAASGEGVLTNPVSLAVDGYNNVIVLDNGGKSIVVFDNFGSPLKRLDLSVPAQKITAWADSILLLREPGDDTTYRLPLYNSRSLELSGIWEIPDAKDLKNVRDISVQNGIVEILSKHRAFVYRTTTVR